MGHPRDSAPPIVDETLTAQQIVSRKRRVGLFLVRRSPEHASEQQAHHPNGLPATRTCRNVPWALFHQSALVQRSSRAQKYKSASPAGSVLLQQGPGRTGCPWSGSDGPVVWCGRGRRSVNVGLVDLNVGLADAARESHVHGAESHTRLPTALLTARRTTGPQNSQEAPTRPGPCRCKRHQHTSTSTPGTHAYDTRATKVPAVKP
ncbi:MAG: hypothetical protein JWQ81_2712 [Amycolatopsis sp.]|nr:hypothetical protein [Amycolatopsis sp.]